MKINNDVLPLELQGANSRGYLHNLDVYRGKDFVMELKNGQKMPVREWVTRVMRVVEIYSEYTEYRTTQRKGACLEAVNTSFYGDDNEICKVTWNDGTTTTVRWNRMDTAFSYEAALAYAYIKKVHGLKAMDMMFESIDAFARAEQAKQMAKLLADAETARKKAKAYKKRVKNEVRRKKRNMKFKADVEAALNNELV